jgi:HPt (histidine-containing phosphotransfer) domain-containing protein
MAGPDTALRILHQMQIDLAATAAQIVPAIAAADSAVIRAQTHVLISLAGTIGAMRLHGLAVDLNAAAHDEDAARIATLAGPLLDDLTALIALLASHLPPNQAHEASTDDAAA